MQVQSHILTYDTSGIRIQVHSRILTSDTSGMKTQAQLHILTSDICHQPLGGAGTKHGRPSGDIVATCTIGHFDMELNAARI